MCKPGDKPTRKKSETAHVGRPVVVQQCRQARQRGSARPRANRRCVKQVEPAPPASSLKYVVDMEAGPVEARQNGCPAWRTFRPDVPVGHCELGSRALPGTTND